MTTQDIINFINANIKTNGANQITGDQLNQALLYMLQVITSGITIANDYALMFAAPLRQALDYIRVATVITDIQLYGADTLQYSINGGKTFTTLTLPLAQPLTFAANTWVIWQVNFSVTSVLAGADVLIQQ